MAWLLIMVAINADGTGITPFHARFADEVRRIAANIAKLPSAVRPSPRLKLRIW